MKKFVVLVLCLTFANTTLAEDKKKKPKDEPRTTATFKKRDKDKDGKLSLNEFTDNTANGQRAAKIFGSLDKDSDAYLSEKEYLGKAPTKF